MPPPPTAHDETAWPPIVTLFLVLAFGISWGAHGLRTLLDVTGPVREALDLTVKFGPSLAGLIAAAWARGAAGVGDLLARTVRRPSPWLGVALLLPVAVLAVSAPLWHGLTATRMGASLAPAAALTIFGAQLARRFFLGGGLGEELGWRGLMLPALQERMDPLRASVWIAVFWSGWHLPAYGVAVVILFPLSAALSVTFTWLYNRTGGGLLAPILIHAAVNASLPTVEAIFPPLDDAVGHQLLLLAIWVAFAALLAKRIDPRLGLARGDR